jgi:tellurite resistance protein
MTYGEIYANARDEQRQRHAERSAIVVTAWEIARQKGATIEERWEIYEREVDRLNREFEEKWGVPAARV